LQIFLARDIASESIRNRDSQDELWERILEDDYMKYAVMECYHSVKVILRAVLEEEGRKWSVGKGIYCFCVKLNFTTDANAFA